MVWDIGAGSGSVAIEAAQLAYLGMVYAIEPEPADIALIQANAESFGVPNVRPVLGPGARSAGELARARRHLRGRDRPPGRTWSSARPIIGSVPGGSLAVNVATIEGLASALPDPQGAGRRGPGLERVRSARGIEQMDRLRFEAMPPTFLLAVTKQDQGDD